MTKLSGLGQSDSIYRACTQALGRSERDALTLLSEEFGYHPTLVMENSHVRCYYLSMLGVELMFRRKSDSLLAAVFVIDASGRRQQRVSAFEGDLLFGVTPQDSISNVQSKIDRKAKHLTIRQESSLQYDFDDREVSFYFDEAGKHMKLAVVRLKRKRKAHKVLG